VRNRSMAFVLRDNKILMEKVFYDKRFFYTIPGGGIEGDEIPEETVLRELKEECGLDGKIVRKLTTIFHSDGSQEHVFEVDVPLEQIPIKGYDPEEPKDNQPIKEVCWIHLSELSERDRAFMWAYGLMEIDGFFEEVKRWGDEISYPTFR